MAGTTLLAYGVVFVLLIGEIDLSIAYVSGVAGVVVAQLQLPGSSHQYPAIVAMAAALLAGTAIGAFQGSIVALIGVPSFVVTLAGFEIWQGVILKSIPQGVIVIQDRHDQQRLAVLLLGWRAAGSSRRSSASPTWAARSAACSHHVVTAWPCATRSCSWPS